MFYTNCKRMGRKHGLLKQNYKLKLRINRTNENVNDYTRLRDRIRKRDKMLF